MPPPNRPAEASSAQLAGALHAACDGILLIGADGRLILANPRMAQLFPALAGHLRPGTPMARLLGAARGHGLLASFRQTGRRLRAVFAAPWALKLPPEPSGPRWLRIACSPTPQGGVLILCADITIAASHADKLEQANVSFDFALNNITQGLCLFAPDKTLRLANRRFIDMFSVAGSVVRPGSHLSQILRPSLFAAGETQADVAARQAAIQAVTESGKPQRFVRTMATGRVIETLHVPLADGGWVDTFEDITERRESEARIAFLARHDPLTRLPNRAHLADRLHTAIAGLGRQARFALLCMDLDRFKPVNDLLGHGIGDKLLCAVAERLSACVRETDLVARLGGDEFAVLQTGIERLEQTGELAQRLVAAIARPFAIDGFQVSIGASIGIALAPNDGALADTLLRNADTALYRAKQDGRGTYRSFEAEMDARLQARRSMEVDLRLALPSGEFELHYQPLVDALTRRVTGFEALLRWHHPTRGMVSPAEFVPVAEDIGLIVPIGRWVIANACAQAACWPGPLHVAVNVSPLQFKDPHLVDVVVDALAASGLPARRLDVEITESVLLDSNDSTLRVLRQLHALGARISMDDFGTGYSSLSYLRSFPFDKIKIDQSFVRGLETSAESALIVGAIAGLGRSLGMRILAEGVETEGELAHLRAAGCQEVQGYLFSRPLPQAEVPGMLARLNGRVAA